ATNLDTLDFGVPVARQRAGQEPWNILESTWSGSTDPQRMTIPQPLGYVIAKHDDVARILSLWNGRERDLYGTVEAKVLERMNGEIDVSRNKGGIDFRGEELLAFDLAEWQIGDAIAASFDRDEFDFGVRIERLDALSDPQALRPCECRSPGAEAQPSFEHHALCAKRERSSQPCATPAPPSPRSCARSRQALRAWSS